MSSSPVRPEKQAALKERFASLDIHESDIRESFVVGGGPGGQHAQKNATAVQLLHEPTGTQVTCNKTRSQATNRFLARRMLADLIDEKVNGKTSARAKAAEKIRKQKKRRGRRSRNAAGESDDA